MNVLLVLIISLIIYWLAFRFYSTYIARSIRVNDNRPTPAHTLQDDLDYVPSKPMVLFSHHFATIAGAGPIVGPAMAAVYGFVPTWLWIIVGAVFLGAVHDYTSFFVSLREKGRSIVEITGRTTGKLGFFLYIAFTILLLLLVCAAFLNLSVQALTSFYPLAKFALIPRESWLPVHVFLREGIEQVRIGGIATTSVIIMTAFAPIMGYFLYRRGARVLPMSILAILVAVGSILVGFWFPVSFGTMTDLQIRLVWMLVLSGYVLVAAAIPVWIVLQPRDFVNSFILYSGLAVMFVAVVVGGLAGLSTAGTPAFSVAEGTKHLGLIWPIMFITIACGAISGFHSLVSTGTSSKQCDRERHARYIGYGGMLLESMLALLVLIAIAAGLGYSGYMAEAWGPHANIVLAFAMGMGGLLHKGLAIPLYLGTIFGILMIEGFLVTTLDTAVRLNRYLLEELWKFLFGKRVPKFLLAPAFNALLTVVLTFILAYPNAIKAIWPLFGTANQMMAALTLITVSLWLAYRLRPSWFTVLPAIFMVATTFASLVIITLRTWHKLVTSYSGATLTLFVVGVVLLLFSVGVVVLGVWKAWELVTGRVEPVGEAHAG